MHRGRLWVGACLLRSFPVYVAPSLCSSSLRELAVCCSVRGEQLRPTATQQLHVPCGWLAPAAGSCSSQPGERPDKVGRHLKSCFKHTFIRSHPQTSGCPRLLWIRQTLPRVSDDPPQLRLSPQPIPASGLLLPSTAQRSRRAGAEPPGTCVCSRKPGHKRPL